MTGFHICYFEDMHPDECDGPGKCCHCDRRETLHHCVAKCAFCQDDVEHGADPLPRWPDGCRPFALAWRKP